MKFDYKQLLVLFFFALSITSCVTYVKNPSVQVASSLYNPGSSKLHPDYKVYHISDTTSVLIGRLFATELVFHQKGKAYTASYQIKFELYDTQQKTLIDSASMNYVLERKNMDKRVINYLIISAKKGKKYFLKIKTTDMGRNSFTSTYLTFDKRNKYSSQNYNVLGRNRVPVFSNFFQTKETIQIDHKRLEADSFSIHYARRDNYLPPPPFSSTRIDTLKIQFDSLWYVRGQQKNNLKLRQTGFYFLQTKPDAPAGLLLNNFGEHYPFIKTSSQMIEPLVYISSSKEYKELKNSKIEKLAIDNFWLKMTQDNADNARELIRIYYNRVLFANIYFQSTTEGWRTDRGMIYTVYGPPNAVQKTIDGETWLYGNGKASVLRFVFNKIDNPYSDNYYLLKRSFNFKQSWFKAINSWRNGKVYTITAS